MGLINRRAVGCGFGGKAPKVLHSGFFWQCHRRPKINVPNWNIGNTGGVEAQAGKGGSPVREWSRICERYTLLPHRLPADRPAIHHYNVRATRVRVNLNGRNYATVHLAHAF